MNWTTLDKQVLKKVFFVDEETFAPLSNGAEPKMALLYSTGMSAALVLSGPDPTVPIESSPELPFDTLDELAQVLFFYRTEQNTVVASLTTYEVHAQGIAEHLKDQLSTGEQLADMILNVLAHCGMYGFTLRRINYDPEENPFTGCDADHPSRWV